MREPHTETVDESLLMEPHANSEKLTLVTRSVGSMRAGSQIKLNSKIKAMIISMKRALGISSDS
jgi:hypothetical protein